MFTTTSYSVDNTPAYIFEAEKGELKDFLKSVASSMPQTKGRHPELKTAQAGKNHFVRNLRAAFDIETSKAKAIKISTGEEIEGSFTYCLQFALNDRVYIMRSWDQFIDMMNAVHAKFLKAEKAQLFVLVHNLGYEYSFMKKIISHSKFFGKSGTRPINFNADKFFFQCSQMLTNSSLEGLSNDYNTHFKKSKEDFDYNITRNSATPLTDAEYKYVAVDVLALTEFAEYLYTNYLDNGWMPCTATQMVERRIIDALTLDRARDFLPADKVTKLINNVTKRAKNYADKAKSKADNMSQATYDQIYNDTYNKYLPAAIKKAVHEHIYGYGGFNPASNVKFFSDCGLVNPEWFRPYDETGFEIPLDKTAPKNLFQHLYYGGCTLSAPENTNVVFDETDDLTGFDITSSYPYVMVAYNYPVNRFEEVDPQWFSYFLNTYSFDEDSFDFNNTRWFMCATFHDVVVKCKRIGVHPFSKVEAENPTVVNGKIMCAKSVTCMLTDVNYDTFRTFYTYSSITVYYIYASKEAKPLPGYILAPLIDAYVEKAKLKKDGKSGTIQYTTEKVIVNSMYGLTVKAPQWHEITFEYDAATDTYITTTTNKTTGVVTTSEPGMPDKQEVDTKKIKTTEKIFGSSILSPFWGIWVAGFARWRLCKMIAAVANNNVTNDFIYGDTDSLYVKNRALHAHIFELESVRAMDRLRNRGMLKPAQIQYVANTPEDTLGGWTCIEKDDTKSKDAKIIRFKTLGAKRYLKTYRYTNKAGELTEDLHAVVAGLPTHKFEEEVTDTGERKFEKINLYKDYCDRNNLDYYDNFQAGMNFEIDSYDIGKLAHAYVNEPIMADVDDGTTVVTMISPTCTVLSPTSFKINYAQIQKNLMEFVSLMKVGKI